MPAFYGHSIFNDTSYHPPGRPEGHMSPSERKAWRKYIAYDRAHHEAIVAEFKAEAEPGEMFIEWCQRKINQQMNDNANRLFHVMNETFAKPRVSDGPFVHIKKSS